MTPLATVDRDSVEESTPTLTAAKAITSRNSSPTSSWARVTAPATIVRHMTGKPQIISSASMAKLSMALPATIRKDRVLVTSSNSRVCRSRSPAMAPEVMAGAIRIIRINWVIISAW